MSHKTTIRTKIKSLTALATACKKFKGAKLTVGKCRAQGYSGAEESDAKITLAGATYEIGLHRTSGGDYTLSGYISDDTNLLNAFSEGYNKPAGKLMKEYSIALVEEEAKKKGMRVKATTAKSGEVTLKLSGGKLTGNKHVLAKVGGDGTVDLDAMEFEGPECAEATKDMERALGTKESCQCKPEMAKKPKLRIKA